MTSPRDGYCESSDLLIGNIPLPTYVTREQVIAAAADEIDSRLGFLYVIPMVTVIDPAPADPKDQVPPVVGLTLKRINAALASGRLILQVDSSGEDKQLHAYGLSLVTESLAALECLANGDPILDGLPQVDSDTDPVIKGPMINNLDSESSVEAFYNRIGNPNYSYFPYSIPVGDGYRSDGLVGR